MWTSAMGKISQRCASMSNRPVFFLYTRVRVRKKANLVFLFPFFILFAFVDILDDIAQLIKVFSPRAGALPETGETHTAAAWVASITGILLDLTWELAMKTGPLDLVDVDIRDKDESILVKVLTR